MHICIFGMTESGKTTVAKELIKRFQMTGSKAIVLDPLNDPAFNADFQTNKIDEFERVVFNPNTRRCLVVIDETSEQGKYNEVIRKCATKGRHWGHTCLFLAQKATQIDPLVRDQCGAVFLFGSGHKSASIVAEEFNSREMLKALDFAAGDYIYKTRFGSPQFGNIFKEAGIIPKGSKNMRKNAETKKRVKKGN